MNNQENNNQAIICREIVKSYCTEDTVTPALRGINFSVNRSELFMLVGPSGCGKTTLISIIAGILNIDQGECEVLGRNLSNMSERDKTAFRCKNIGFVFQSYNLLPNLTSRENVAIPLLIAGVPRKIAIEKATEVLEQVGLKDKLNVQPIHLSGGQQQRVAIARAMVHNPSIIVCDEPTSALDQETGQKIMQIFRDVALRDGRTLVIVTHDTRIFKYADRIAKMNDGRIELVATDYIELGYH